MSAAVLVVMLVVLGFLGFCALALFLLYHILREVFGWFGRDTSASGSRAAWRSAQVCPHNGCGHHNSRDGVYCSRCGRQLAERREIDAYG